MTVEYFRFNEQSEKNQLIISKILYKSFELKFKPILKKVGYDEGLQIIKNTLIPTGGLLAREATSIIGVAILSTKSSPALFIEKSLKKRLGLISYQYFKFIFHSDKILTDDTIKIELLAIKKGTRGKGYGSSLLKEIIRYSRTAKYKKILLDVVDTNPRAKALYKRVGFKTIKRHYSGVLTKSFGYNSHDSMSLNINKKYKSY